MNQYLLGVDIGTGGCKATVIRPDGSFVSDGYVEYPSYHPHMGWVEQKPEDWFNAMVSALRIASNKGGFCLNEIIGLAVDASAHNAVLLGRKGASGGVPEKGVS